MVALVAPACGRSAQTVTSSSSSDGDGSDCPELIPLLVQPILAGHSRLRHRIARAREREPGSMNTQQIIAGKIVGALLDYSTVCVTTDMCPFRAIRRDQLERLGLREETYGWNLKCKCELLAHA